MGSWVPDPGTMYRTLFERSVDIFNIPGDLLGSLGCSGDPAGMYCRCSATSEEFLITLQTPQIFGRNPFIKHFDHRHKIRSWPFRGRQWSFETGFLNVSRITSKTSPHLEWIDVPSIVGGFYMSISPAGMDAADKCLEKLRIGADWLSPRLRHDEVYEFILSDETDPRAIRMETLLMNKMHHIVIWEVQNSPALDIFTYQPGFAIGDIANVVSKMDASQRLEVLTLEFRLAGESSFDFTVA